MGDGLRRLVEQQTAEINRRRGEMAVAREYLDEQGVPSERDGVTLTFRQRLMIVFEGRSKGTS